MILNQQDSSVICRFKITNGKSHFALQDVFEEVYEAIDTLIVPFHFNHSDLKTNFRKVSNIIITLILAETPIYY